jgi:AcrR family transcriptional regulator
MATGYSRKSRISARRQVTIDEALAHAIDVMTENGVAALSISEVARRMEIRPPSLYKYFPSLHAVYDVLFARGMKSHAEVTLSAVYATPVGVGQVKAAAVASVRWCVENRALAQLMFSRPIPNFEPSEAAFAPSVDAMNRTGAAFAQLIEGGHLRSDTDLDEFVAMFTVVISGVINQQFANEPGVSFETGRFTSRTERAIDVLLASYLPRPNK